MTTCRNCKTQFNPPIPTVKNCTACRTTRLTVRALFHQVDATQTMLDFYDRLGDRGDKVEECLQTLKDLNATINSIDPDGRY